MASKIILKKSSVASKAPVAGDLDFGELAINYTDSKLYFKKADGSIDAFTSAAASAPVTSVGGNIGDITDTQLLTSIKNVDGSGSGLDADFLDGNHASAFYLASNPNGYTSNTGTVTSVGATAPLVSSGGTAPSISIPAANSTTNGYMSSAYASKLDGIAAGATANTGTVTSVSGTGTVSGLTLSGTVTTSGNLTLGGTLSLTSGQVTTALGYTPYNSTNPSGYVTTAGARSALSFTAGSGNYNSSTGVITIPTNTNQLTNGAGFITGITINYNNDSNSTYQMLWGSGNAVYGTAGIYCNPSNDYMYAAAFSATSDETLKTNWRGFDNNFIEELAKVKHGTYDRVDVELTQDGVSAQSLQTILPNSVTEGKDGKLSVNYGNAALVSSVELAKRMVEQDKRIAELERLVSKLIGD